MIRHFRLRHIFSAGRYRDHVIVSLDQIGVLVAPSARYDACRGKRQLDIEYLQKIAAGETARRIVSSLAAHYPGSMNAPVGGDRMFKCRIDMPHSIVIALGWPTRVTLSRCRMFSAWPILTGAAPSMAKTKTQAIWFDLMNWRTAGE